MRKHLSLNSATVICLAVAGAICGAGTAQAQEAMMGPPKVLTITREDVKPGKTGAVHERAEAGFVHAIAKAQGNHYLAATTVTGPNVALFLTPYSSFAEWEQDTQKQEKAVGAELDAASQRDGELLTGVRTATFILRPDLSYNPDVPIKGTRYFAIYSAHVKPGHGDEFVAVRKRIVAVHQKLNLPDHLAVFEAVFGAPQGTYLVFVPLKSLTEIDQYPVVHGKAYQDAIGEDGHKAEREFDRNGLASSEINLVALNPRMSYVSKEWIAADPDFWSPKPAAAKAKAVPAAKKKRGAQ